MSNKRIVFLILGFVVVALSLMAYWLSSSAQGSMLLVEKVTRGDIENYIGATGALEPKQYVEVGAQVSGQIKKIYIEEGDLVEAGQLLA